MTNIDSIPCYEKHKKTCRDCGKEIRFIKNKFNNKFMPVEAKAIKIVTNEGTIISGYIPHWEVCIHAVNNNFNN